MPRDLPLGNGRLLVTFDAGYNLRDLYYPHVGEENQTAGGVSRLGVWVDGAFSWLSDWDLELRYLPDTLVTDVVARNRELGLWIRANDAVDHAANVLVRRFTVGDETGRERAVRLFVHLDPSLRESQSGNAAYYDGIRSALICHKGDRYLLLASQPPLTEFAVGKKGAPGREGTWRDAEDGQLSNNPVDTGSVDATLRFDLTVPANGEAVGYCWLAVGQHLAEVSALHDRIGRDPGYAIAQTEQRWRFWLHPARGEFGDLSDAAADLYRRSLLTVRTQIDENGAIVAANDGDIVAFGADSYSYVWPRDAAIVADALGEAGYHEAPRRFFSFLHTMLAQPNAEFPGYLLHRYTPSGHVAASWHAGYEGGRLRLPIQEDETALTLYALGRHFARTGDVELVSGLYHEFVRSAADFLLVYRDPLTGLPQPSYDLWEEKHGVFLFTCGAVAAGLDAAATLAEAFGDPVADDYRAGAAEVREAVARHLYDPDLGRFLMAVTPCADGSYQPDLGLDSSMISGLLLGLVPLDDPRAIQTMDALQERLGNAPPIGGIARHSDDYYHHVTGNYADYQGNAWFVSTLWLADWFSATGQREAARERIEWCTHHALQSGVLAEQVHPWTGAPISVSPLTWSHAAFVASVDRYLRLPVEQHSGS